MAKIIVEGGAPARMATCAFPAPRTPCCRSCAPPCWPMSRCSIGNVPHLHDVTTTMELLGQMGVRLVVDERMRSMSTRQGQQLLRALRLVKTMRASVLVLGPLVAKFGDAEVSLPGGCAIGIAPGRPAHQGPAGAGCRDHRRRTATSRRAAKRLKGARIVLDLVTVGGTENLMMAAALAEGTTVIENAAQEPEVVDLADCLIAWARASRAPAPRHRDRRRRARCTAAITKCCPTASRPAPSWSPRASNSVSA
jgi:UDP-N-acetylglucosamine 1-carboxyvinyltransferase